MKYGIFTMVCWSLAITLSAHNPLSATYYIEVDEKVSVLHLYLAQTGVEQALLQHYSAEELNAMSMVEYKQMIVDYVRDHFQVYADQQAIVLGAGGIKLGSHQTDLKFLVEGIDESINRLHVDLPAFAENEHHQSVFSYLIYGKKGKAILSANNDFRADIDFMEASSSNAMPIIIVIGGSVLVIGLLLVRFLLWRPSALTQKRNVLSV